MFFRFSFGENHMCCFMKILAIILATAVFSGCTPLVVRMAPTPSSQQLALDRQLHARTIAVPMETVFPQVLDVLMDNGLIIRSANEKVGLISFSQQWNDPSQHFSPNITLEGSLLFRPLGPNSVQARLLLSGNWQIATKEGPDYGVIQQIDAREYESILDAIEHGLVSGNKK